MRLFNTVATNEFGKVFSVDDTKNVTRVTPEMIRKFGKLHVRINYEFVYMKSPIYVPMYIPGAWWQYGIYEEDLLRINIS